MTLPTKDPGRFKSRRWITRTVVGIVLATYFSDITVRNRKRCRAGGAIDFADLLWVLSAWGPCAE